MDEKITPVEPVEPTAQPIEQAIAKIDFQHVIEQVLSILERSTAKTGLYTAILMGGVIFAFTGLAGMALALNHVDTAEKLMIALISFIGGAAIFGGNVKK